MQLLSVNVSLPTNIEYRGRQVRTGIFKAPVAGPVMLRALNLDGDAQADLQNHGGGHKAACVYAIENYRYWQSRLGRGDFGWGQFGENFTVEGMLEDDIHIGDRFRVGGAVIEVTQPRVPCYKLSMKMGLRDFARQFLTSLRVGFYVRVLEEGEVAAGDAIRRLVVGPGRISVREAIHLLYFDPENLSDARRALSVEAFSPAWLQSFADRLANAPAPDPPSKDSAARR